MKLNPSLVTGLEAFLQIGQRTASGLIRPKSEALIEYERRMRNASGGQSVLVAQTVLDIVSMWKHTEVSVQKELFGFEYDHLKDSPLAIFLSDTGHEVRMQIVVVENPTTNIVALDDPTDIGTPILFVRGDKGSVEHLSEIIAEQCGCTDCNCYGEVIVRIWSNHPDMARNIAKNIPVSMAAPQAPPKTKSLRIRAS